MSLPHNDTTWPPSQWQPVFDMAAESASWWEGDPKNLSAQYAGKIRAAQFDGGVVGATARFFWGKPQLRGQSQQKMHIPLAADIAATSASLLFDTPPTITHADETVQQRLDTLVNSEAFAAQLLVAGESASALGGVYWRVQWNQAIAPTPWLEWVDVDSAIPEWQYGRLVAVTIVEQLPTIDEKTTHRLLTRYTPGRIEYQLMAGRDNNLGKTIPLTEHPTTEGLAALLTDGDGMATGVNVMLAGYIPNARPVVRFRRDGQLRNMGRPDLSPDIYDLLDALDETWTKLMREIRLGQMRITVPDYMLDTHGPGQGASIDVDREIYDTLAAPPSSNMGPQFHQPQLRVDEHLRTAEAIIREVIRRVNLSPITFGLTDSTAGQMTAREITAKWQASLQTWKAKVRYWRAGLNEAAVAILHIDALLRGEPLNLDELPVVEFAPPVQETTLDKAQTVQALEAARAISTKQKVTQIHPEWNSTAVEEETAAILREQAGVFDPVLSAAPDGMLGSPGIEE